MSRMSTQDLISNWVRNVYMKGRNPLDEVDNAAYFDVEFETKSGGYCETCWYEYTTCVIYAISDTKARTEIGEYSVDSMVEFLDVILKAEESE